MIIRVIKIKTRITLKIEIIHLICFPQQKKKEVHLMHRLFEIKKDCYKRKNLMILMM